MTHSETITEAIEEEKAALIDPKADGWTWDEDPVDQDTLEELVCEVINDVAEVDFYEEDDSFSYEYGSICGVHGGKYLTHDGAVAVIGFVGAPNDLPALPSFTAGYDGLDTDIDWSPAHTERREGTLYVVYTA
jgi:hypothetical protein